MKLVHRMYASRLHSLSRTIRQPWLKASCGIDLTKHDARIRKWPDIMKICKANSKCTPSTVGRHTCATMACGNVQPKVLNRGGA